MHCQNLLRIFLVWVCTANWSYAVLDIDIEKYVRDLKLPKILPAESNNRGFVGNCGDAKTNLTIWWEPKDVSKRGSIKGHFDMIAPVDWSIGPIKISVSVGAFHVLSKTVSGSCDMIHKHLPNLCPFKSGEIISQEFNIQKIPGKVRSGHTYSFKIDVSNSKGKQFMCAEGKIKVTP